MADKQNLAACKFTGRRFRKTMVILDFGCGSNKVPGAIGTDRCLLPGVDVMSDLSRPPYPFANDCADEIHLNHVLEHMPSAIGVLEDIWRITRPGGKVFIRVPHYSGVLAWKDPTHVRSFASESFGYFGENPYSYYTHARFKVRSIRLQYFTNPSWRLIYRIWGGLVQWILDRHPTFSERFLASLIGGIEEIRVTLEAVKEAGGTHRRR